MRRATWAPPPCCCVGCPPGDLFSKRVLTLLPAMSGLGRTRVGKWSTTPPFGTFGRHREEVAMQTVPTEFRNPVVALSGEIDMANAVGIAHSVKPLIKAGGPIVIDVSGVTFIDSTGVQALFAVVDALGDRGCVVLHGVNGTVRKIIDLIQLQSVRPNIHIIDCTVLALAS